MFRVVRCNGDLLHLLQVMSLATEYPSYRWTRRVGQLGKRLCQKCYANRKSYFQYALHVICEVAFGTRSARAVTSRRDQPL